MLSTSIVVYGESRNVVGSHYDIMSGYYKQKYIPLHILTDSCFVKQIKATEYNSNYWYWRDTDYTMKIGDWPNNKMKHNAL